MGISIGLPSFPVEVLFGLVAVFLFFAPIALDWNWMSYAGCLFFAALTVLVVRARK